MQSLYSGLVAYWNLQDASGSRLDLVGGNTLTNTNTVTSVDGIIGGASNFVAASSQRLNAASSTVLQGGSKDYTIACWVNLATVASIQNIVAKLSITSGQSEYTLRYTNSVSRFQMNVYTATDIARGISANTFGAPSAGVWYFVAGWYDNNAQTVNVEVNCTGVDSASTTAAAQAASTAQFNIGASAIPDLFLNGAVCEVGKWDRVLTAQERRWLYNNGRGRTYPFTGRYSIALSRHGRSRRMQGIG